MDDLSSKISKLSPKVRAIQSQDLATRALRIKEAIAQLTQEIQQLELEGDSRSA